MSSDSEAIKQRLRALPAVDRVLQALDVTTPAQAVGAIREVIDDVRRAVRSGEEAPSIEVIVERVKGRLAEAQSLRLRPLINATGVLIHTNLGRAPLGRRQLDAVNEIAGAYSNLEYDLVAGTRGSRYHHAKALLTSLTGAEDALVVNNNAAAVLLVLSGLCAGREVIISRGELIEIGGEFRIPDVMAASGAKLVEVGTTNRTHLGDYERAITPETAAFLKVHPSNYRMVGFTASVAARDLIRLARGRGVCFINDLGSGLIEAEPGADWVAGEPLVESCVAEGADIVTFSGDKLLGGPQAGIILGRANLIEKLSKNPLLRALRVDKMTLAALEATLASHVDKRPTELPLWELAGASEEDLERRARVLAAQINGAIEKLGVKVEAVASRSVAGGGSLPDTEIGSWGIALEHPERSAAELARGLRRGEVPVVSRIDAERVILDLRTVFPAQDPALAALTIEALRD